MSVLDNIVSMLNLRIENHRDAVLGHDSVHPARGDCGGVGRCALMRLERDLEREITETLSRLASDGQRVRVVKG